MFLANFIFVVSYLKIHPALDLNTSNALSFLSKRKVYERFSSFRYSYVLTLCFNLMFFVLMLKNNKMLVKCRDVQIEPTRMLISYNNDNAIIKISRYIENPGLVRTVYSDISRHIQRHSAIFSYIQTY